MRPAAQYLAAGVVAVALGAAPGFAQAQTTGSSGSSPQGSSSQGAGTAQTPSTTSGSQGTSTTTTTTSTTQSSSSSGGVDEAAAREHLSQARQALADLTKLPAATQLQGEQRTTIASFIQAFNAFATATTDWRSKFATVSTQLDQILASAGAGDTSTGTSGTSAGSTAGSTTGSASASGSTGSAGTGAAGSASATAGGYDPSIISKLREVRTHLDAFQEASGDPTPHFDAIEKIIDSALNGTSSGSGSVGTSGTSASATGTTGDASASGSVTLTRSQLEEIRQHVEKLRAASNAAAAKQ